jgi:hypothetical protein
MRATMRGLADAIADPDAAAAAVVLARRRRTATRTSCRPRARPSAGRPMRGDRGVDPRRQCDPASPSRRARRAQVAAYDAVGYYGDGGRRRSTAASTPTSSRACTTSRHRHLARLTATQTGRQTPSSSRAWATSCLQLRDERVDAVELALAAEEVGEPHLRPLAVEVALEVDQVGLEQRAVGVLVEGGAPAEVDRARVHVAVGRSYHPAYTPSAGRHTRFGTSTLAVGKPSSRPRWSPVTTVPRASNGRPSIAAANSTLPPASARRMAVLLTGSSTPSCARDEHERGHLEPVGGTRPPGAGRRCPPGCGRSGSRRRRRSASVARHLTSTRSMNDRAGVLRLRLVERQHHGGVDAGLLEQLEPLLVVGQQLRGRLGPHDVAGWRSKVTTAERHRDAAA